MRAAPAEWRIWPPPGLQMRMAVCRLVQGGCDSRPLWLFVARREELRLAPCRWVVVRHDGGMVAQSILAHTMHEAAPHGAQRLAGEDVVEAAAVGLAAAAPVPAELFGPWVERGTSR